MRKDFFFLVKAADKFGYINILGKEFIPLKYDFARPFQEGYSTVRKEGRWYFLNKNGEEFPIFYNGTENFENVSELTNGFSTVTFKGKKGFIDKDIYELSKKALIDFDGILSESKKVELIDKFLATENIKESNFNKRFDLVKKYVKDLYPGEKTIEEVKKMAKR